MEKQHIPHSRSNASQHDAPGSHLRASADRLPSRHEVQAAVRLVGNDFHVLAAPRLRADLVEMQNGDRYSGKVLSVSADTVVLDSEVLGKINVPRKKVASLMFGTNAAAPKAAANIARVSVSTNLPTTASSAALANTNLDLSAAFRNLGANTNFVGQIRQQMLAGSPEAAGKYDEMVNGLMSGELNLNDLRREAKSSADQLRELKRDLGPEAGDSIDAYLGCWIIFSRKLPPSQRSPLPLPSQNLKPVRQQPR